MSAKSSNRAEMAPPAAGPPIARTDLHRTQSVADLGGPVSAPRVGHTPLSRSTASLPVLPSQAPDNYFHYNQYHPTPEVFYTTDLAAADVRLRELRGPFMGLDMEWPYEKIQQDSFRFIEKIGKTAMIQVCDERLIVMLHLQDASNPTIYKCGVQVRNDGYKLQSDFPGLFPTGIRSFLELSNIARILNPDQKSYPKGGPADRRRLVSLANLTEKFIGKKLLKDPAVRGCDWAGDLSQKEKDYAANDAFVSLQICLELIKCAIDRGTHIDLDYCVNTINADGTHYRGVLTERTKIRPNRAGDASANDEGTTPLHRATASAASALPILAVPPAIGTTSISTIPALSPSVDSYTDPTDPSTTHALPTPTDLPGQPAITLPTSPIIPRPISALPVRAIPPLTSATTSAMPAAPAERADPPMDVLSEHNGDGDVTETDDGEEEGGGPGHRTKRRRTAGVEQGDSASSSQLRVQAGLTSTELAQPSPITDVSMEGDSGRRLRPADSGIGMGEEAPACPAETKKGAAGLSAEDEALALAMLAEPMTQGDGATGEIAAKLAGGGAKAPASSVAAVPLDLNAELA